MTSSTWARSSAWTERLASNKEGKPREAFKQRRTLGEFLFGSNQMVRGSNPLASVRVHSSDGRALGSYQARRAGGTGGLEASVRANLLLKYVEFRACGTPSMRGFKSLWTHGGIDA